MLKQEYVYNAYVVDVYDGDSITLDIDLGFNIVMKNQKIRLYGIDAPELRLEEKESGLISKNWLVERILNKNVVIKTYKDSRDKYGRWLADIYVGDVFINETMVIEGLAIKY